MLYTTLGPQYHQPKGHILELLSVLKNDLAFNINESSPGSINSNLLRIWAFRHGDLGLPKELSTPNALYWLYPKGSTFMDNMTFSQKPNQSQTLLRGKRRGCVSLPSSPPVAKHEPPTKNILCGGKSLESNYFKVLWTNLTVFYQIRADPFQNWLRHRYKSILII